MLQSELPTTPETPYLLPLQHPRRRSTMPLNFWDPVRLPDTKRCRCWPEPKMQQVQHLRKRVSSGCSNMLFCFSFSCPSVKLSPHSAFFALSSRHYFRRWQPPANLVRGDSCNILYQNFADCAQRIYCFFPRLNPSSNACFLGLSADGTRCCASGPSHSTLQPSHSRNA